MNSHFFSEWRLTDVVLLLYFKALVREGFRCTSSGMFDVESMTKSQELLELGAQVD